MKKKDITNIINSLTEYFHKNTGNYKRLHGGKATRVKKLRKLHNKWVKEHIVEPVDIDLTTYPPSIKTSKKKVKNKKRRKIIKRDKILFKRI